MLILMMFFVIDCRLWTKAKVNYVFVFEFDTRHHLDWRQLAEVSYGSRQNVYALTFD